MKIGIRGFGNHAKKIEKILLLKEFQVYKISRNFFAEEILPNTQAIFITSPNYTHIKYLEKSLKINNQIPKAPHLYSFTFFCTFDDPLYLKNKVFTTTLEIIILIKT